VDCDGFELSTNGVLDLDLRAITLSGSVTLRGAPLPDEAAPRGYLLFEDARNGASALVDLESTGAFNYRLTLPPGEYDVSFVGNPESCADPSTPPGMPCGSGPLLRAVSLRADGVLDVDIPVVTVSGSVTLDGVTLPDEALDRGRLEFRGSAGSQATTASLGPNGPGGYLVTLLPDSYDVVFAGNPGLCLQTEAALVPCNSGVILEDVEVSDGVLDVDVSAVQISGQVTLLGEPLPAATDTRGQLSFESSEGSVVSTEDLGSADGATYTMTLLPDRYTVGFVGDPGLCAGGAPALPCNSGPLLENVEIDGDGVLDVDVPAVTISGAVGLDGAALPDESGDRGALSFALAGGSQVLGTPFAPTGAATYTMTLLPGDYDVSFVGNPQLCALDDSSLVPCNGDTLLESVSFRSSGVLDLELQSVRVSGSVTVDGAPLADEQADRGQLEFRLASGSSIVTSLGSSGPFAYSLSIAPGHYTVSFIANSALCASDTLPAVPCVGGTLLDDVIITSDGVLDVDVPSLEVRGNVTLNGATLPDESQSRGFIAFSLVDPLGGIGLSDDLRGTGAANYALTVLPGTYVVTHVANEALCGGVNAPAVPCVSQILLGCD
jgi:hypothetical protein